MPGSPTRQAHEVAFVAAAGEPLMGVSVSEEVGMDTVEGKVSVMAPGSDVTQSALTDSFQQRYGISVEYLALSSSSEIATTITEERQAGKYLLDVVITAAPVATLIAQGAFDPLEPGLILPEGYRRQELARWCAVVCRSRPAHLDHGPVPSIDVCGEPEQRQA